METVATFNNVHIGTPTAAGSAYVRKVTHPPSTIPLEFAGVPDASQPNMTSLEVKSEANVPISYTVGASPTTTVTNTTQKMLFVVPSGIKVSAYVFYWVGNGWMQANNQMAVTIPTPTFPGITGNVTSVTNSGYSFVNYNNDVAGIRTTYKSNTFYLNATDFNNQGTITTSKFKPNIFHSTFAELREKWGDKAVAPLLREYNRRQKDVIGVGGTKPRLTEQDMYEFVHANDDKPRDVPFDFQVQVWDFNKGSGTISPYNPWTLDNVVSGILPETPSDLMVISPKGNTRPAKEGAFVVQQPIDSIQPWTSNFQTDRGTGNETIDNTVYSALRNLVGAVSTFIPLTAEALLVASGTHPYGDTVWNNLDWSMTMVDGLSLPAANASPAYITIKGYAGAEIQPRFSSSLLPFLRMLPMPDPTALQMATGIFHARPDSLPASANDLGTIAATAIKYLPTAVSWLKDLFGSKKQKSEAMDKAEKFVAPATHAPKADNRVVNRNTNAEEALRKQVAKLTKRVQQLSTKGAAASLPTYSNDTEYNAPYPRTSRSRSVRRPAPGTTSRARAPPRAQRQ